MAIVNFAIPNTLDRRINQVIKEKGFASKAELFRFAVLYFVDIIGKPAKEAGEDIKEEERFNILTDLVSKEITKVYKNKKIPPIEEQLAQLKKHY